MKFLFHLEKMYDNHRLLHLHQFLLLELHLLHLLLLNNLIILVHSVSTFLVS
jgi:hypothetical protein